MFLIPPIMIIIFLVLYFSEHKGVIKGFGPIQGLVHGKIKMGLNSKNIKGEYKGVPIEIRIAKVGVNLGYLVAIRLHDNNFPVMDFFFKKNALVFKNPGYAWLKEDELKNLGFDKYRIQCKDPAAAKQFLMRQNIADTINNVIKTSHRDPYLLSSYVFRLTNSCAEVRTYVSTLSVSRLIENYLNVATISKVLDDFITLRTG